MKSRKKEIRVVKSKTVENGTMQQSGGIYGGGAQMGLDIEYGSDPAAGGFFNSDYKKHDDLKQMLDSNKDGLKLEAMKRIIGMIARGRDASVLFPAVVKNVVSKNIEVKKLVYVYLVRYAEQEQDLALLSISTFQRALKDPNQLIRASALRVLSSIRVSTIKMFSPLLVILQSIILGTNDCPNCNVGDTRIILGYESVCEEDSSSRHSQIVFTGCRAERGIGSSYREIVVRQDYSSGRFSCHGI